MSDLRDKLAERLCNITLPLMGDATPWQRAQRHTKDYYRKMADECIRQMTWARRGHGSVWFGGVEHKNLPLMIESPPSLAPEDWKP